MQSWFQHRYSSLHGNLFNMLICCSRFLIISFENSCHFSYFCGNYNKFFQDSWWILWLICHSIRKSQQKAIATNRGQSEIVMVFNDSCFRKEIGDFRLVMWRSTQRLRSLYQKRKPLPLKRCIGAWFVLPKAHDLWRPKLHSPENHVTASYLVQTKRTSALFPLHYNALALFSFYPNLYIKVKWNLPMK